MLIKNLKIARIVIAMIYWDLFYTFAKIGLLAFGGGYTIVAFLYDGCVERKKWLKAEELAEYYALSQSLPGIISVNLTAFLGYRRAGFSGALAAVLGLIFPAIVVIVIVAHFMQYVVAWPLMLSLLRGIRIGAAVLILTMAVRLIKTSVGSLLTGLAACLTLLLYMLGYSPVWPIVGAGLLGAFYFWRFKQVLK